jgi:hypothetical protein
VLSYFSQLLHTGDPPSQKSIDADEAFGLRFFSFSRFYIADIKLG